MPPASYETNQTEDVPDKIMMGYLRFAAGPPVWVYGPLGCDISDLLRTAALAWTASTRQIPSFPDRRVPGLPVSEALLSRILKTSYRPWHVVEAVRALRETGGKSDAWLVKVIDSRPELADFAEAIQAAIPKLAVGPDAHPDGGTGKQRVALESGVVHG